MLLPFPNHSPAQSKHTCCATWIIPMLSGTIVCQRSASVAESRGRNAYGCRFSLGAWILWRIETERWRTGLVHTRPIHHTTHAHTCWHAPHKWMIYGVLCRCRAPVVVVVDDVVYCQSVSTREPFFRDSKKHIYLLPPFYDDVMFSHTLRLRSRMYKYIIEFVSLAWRTRSPLRSKFLMSSS